MFWDISGPEAFRFRARFSWVTLAAPALRSGRRGGRPALDAAAHARRLAFPPVGEGRGEGQGRIKTVMPRSPDSPLDSFGD
ncbi:hypothetical protein LMG27198_04920 [Methylocystis echinoides]|uniref:Uncharacterized protein n=1 Tax=Methylocystis echinoides TaxID=29468 RepID=A0A9W6GRG3_9HYPH|nr:hypothetical protein LMG27198_04920 [Methylocystis echinoides]